MKYIDKITLAAAGGAGTMFGFVIVLVVADWSGALDGLLGFLSGIIRVVCQN